MLTKLKGVLFCSPAKQTGPQIAISDMRTLVYWIPYLYASTVSLLNAKADECLRFLELSGSINPENSSTDLLLFFLLISDI